MYDDEEYMYIDPMDDFAEKLSLHDFYDEEDLYRDYRDFDDDDSYDEWDCCSPLDE